MPDSAKANFEFCMNHPERFTRFNKILRRVRSYQDNARGKCECGAEIELWNQYMGACQCQNCGLWYNLFGQELLPPSDWEEYTEEKRWRGALTMPIEAARRYLRVVRVEVEHLQEISPADIAREGIIDRHEFAYMRFKNYWNKKFQHRAYNVKWETNPWVWKISFEIDKPCEQEK